MSDKLIELYKFFGVQSFSPFAIVIDVCVMILFMVIITNFITIVIKGGRR